MKGIHSGHNMMRIASPAGVWPHHFFRRLNKMHDRINKRAASACSATEATEECKYSPEDLPRVPPFGCGRRRPGHRGGPRGRGRFGHAQFGAGNPFPPGCGNNWFEAMMNGWAGEGQSPGSTFQSSAHTNAAKSVHDAVRQAAQFANAASGAAAGTHAAFAAASENATKNEQKSQPPEGQQQTGAPRSQSFDGIGIDKLIGNNAFFS